MVDSLKIKYIAGITAATAGVGVAISYFSTRFLLDIAMKREMPPCAGFLGNHISGKKAAADTTDRRKLASQTLCDQPSQTVVTIARDGMKLVGHYIPCENPKRIIIAAHGWRSSWWWDFGVMADFFRNSDCSVLYIDQRGQHSSGGDYICMGTKECHDLIEWVYWVQEKVGTKLPIYLMGISMGATSVLYSTGCDLPLSVHGIIADCGYTSPAAVWKHVAKNNLHIRYGIKEKIAEHIFKKRTRESTNKYSTKDALSNTDVPVLFIHGSDDKFVPVEMSYENYKACNSPKDILIIPGAGHAESYCKDAEAYESTVMRFWDKYDNS